MEYGTEGNLFQEVHRRGGFLPENTTVNLVVLPLLSALSYLHSKGIIHRDMKPENMMFVKCGKERLLKVADFGLSINCWQEAPTTCAGTVDYMAPEIVLCPPQSDQQGSCSPQLARYDQSVDVWALGILVYEMMIGAPPFEDPDGPQSTARNILETEPEFPDVISAEARDFISMALRKNPSGRPSMSQMMGHPWIQAHSTSMSTKYNGTSLVDALPGRDLPPRQHSWHGQRPSPFTTLHAKTMAALQNAESGSDCELHTDQAALASTSADYSSFQALATPTRQPSNPSKQVQVPRQSAEFDSATSYRGLADAANAFGRSDDSAAGFQPLMNQKIDEHMETDEELNAHPSLESVLLGM
eukprot:scaffold63350_cov42-Prasinocladus_malaysianus.AAC.1